MPERSCLEKLKPLQTSLLVMLYPQTPCVRVFNQRGWCVVFETSAVDYNLGTERDFNDYIDFIRVDVSCRDTEQLP